MDDSMDSVSSKIEGIKLVLQYGIASKKYLHHLNSSAMIEYYSSYVCTNHSLCKNISQRILMQKSEVLGCKPKKENQNYRLYTNTN